MKSSRIVLLVLIYLALIAAGFALSLVLKHWWSTEAAALARPHMQTAMIGVLIVYVIASALPFVPGAEIGLGMIMIFGARAAPLVYMCMVGALVLAYLCGRFVPSHRIARGLSWLGLDRAAGLVLGCAARDYDQRTAFLKARLPKRVVPFVLRHRYIALAILLNLPGNSLLGGGGGLAFAAGASRIFAPVPFVGTILLAVAPIPGLVLLSGLGS
ncbi:hypothetical protein BV911_14015 [Pseudoruegeria sp. SK021]|nr:hypothetical protein BV911_14015 [Pseudoruegeria sp. SK021]